MAHFVWHGDAFKRAVLDRVAERMQRAAAEGVRVAKELVPVETGRTRDSIASTFDRSTLTVQISAGNEVGALH